MGRGPHAAGFDEEEIADARKKVGREKLLEDRRRLADELGRPPTKADVTEHENHAYITY